MPTCANCGSWVSDDYVRVFERRGAETTDCCPRCPDLIRDPTGSPREAQATRRVNQ